MPQISQIELDELRRITNEIGGIAKARTQWIENNNGRNERAARIFGWAYKTIGVVGLLAFTILAIRWWLLQ